VLIGSEYWKDLINWYKHAFQEDFIRMPIQTSFIVADDLDEAVRIIVASCGNKK